MAAKAIQNKVVPHARDLSFAAKDNSERLQPVVLPRAVVRVAIRLRDEAVMPINNNSSLHRVNINRRHASDRSKGRRVATRVVHPVGDAASPVAKGARVKVELARVARHKAALAGLQVARKHRSAKHSATNASSDWIVADSVAIRASELVVGCPSRILRPHRACPGGSRVSALLTSRQSHHASHYSHHARIDRPNE